MICQILHIIYYLVVAVLTLVIGVTVWWYLGVLMRPKKTPPGPWGVPIFGFVPYMMGQGNKGQVFVDLEKKYGSPIISFDRGQVFSIVINDYNILKKAFQEEAFSAKPDGAGEAFLQSANAFGFQEGAIWRENRRFSMATLRDFGLGKSSLEPKTLDEITYFLAEVKKTNGQPLDIDQLLGLSMGNVASLLQFNQRWDYDNQERINLKRLINSVFMYPWVFLLAPMFPWIVSTGLYRKLPGYKIHQEAVDAQTNFIRKILEEHKKNFYPGKKDDYIDAFLTEKADRIKRNDHPEYFDENALISDLRILALIGSETTIITLRWAFVYLMAYPDLQAKIHAEIDSVIGRNRQPSMADKPKMPYFEAFFTEIHRKNALNALIDPHKTTEDTYLEGYFIPKGTSVFANLYAIHNDEKLWPDPFSFRPERFIDENGQFIKTDRLITFGIGKRNCIGEGLARMLIFLYMASMLQNYTIRSPKDQVVTLTADVNVGNVPMPFKICAFIRSFRVFHVFDRQAVVT